MIVNAPRIGRLTESRIREGPATGPLPLTPIAKRWLEQGFANPHHYNQAVFLEAREPLESVVVGAPCSVGAARVGVPGGGAAVVVVDGEAVGGGAG